MRIHILSDLHVDFGPIALPAVDADITVIAGDLCPGKSALNWIWENIPPRPVVYVLGNHEFYGHATPKLIDDFRRLSKGTNVHVLEKESFFLKDVCFMGCTLWTDFCLFGDPAIARRAAASIMNDYHRIRVSPKYGRLKGHDTALFHSLSLRWLREKLAQHTSKPTIIVTHHAPSSQSLSPVDAQELINAAYASNLDDLVEASKARLWVHGHIHHPADYAIGETRVISNPRGYAHERSDNFNPGLVVEV